MAKTLSIIFGIVFIIVGILGFIGNPIVGENATFATNSAHDIVHLLAGIVLLLAGFAGAKSGALAMKVFGFIYLLVAILGFTMSSPLLGVLEYNSADNWLHVVLAVVLIAAGWAGCKKDDSTGAAPMNPSQPTM